jgi:hypothetical protein
MPDQELILTAHPVAAQAWEQAGLMVMDGSHSMTQPYAGDGEGPSDHSKGQAVGESMQSFARRLQSSGNAVNFSLGYVSFNDKVTDRRSPQPVLEIDPNVSYDPTDHGTGGTAIHTGLDAAAEMIEEFMGRPHEVPTSAIAVLLSDGEDRGDPAKTAAAAARLRELPSTKLAACLFATHGASASGETLLQEIVSEPGLYKRIYNTEELRAFFRDTVTVHHGGGVE